jgi:hypothetical protein
MARMYASHSGGDLKPDLHLSPAFYRHQVVMVALSRVKNLDATQWPLCFYRVFGDLMPFAWAR